MATRIVARSFAVLTALAFNTPTGAMSQFLSLSDEAKTVTTLIKCPSPSLQTDAELPPLWSCLVRPREVVKVFIDGNREKGVEKVTVIWDDWTKDRGYGGVHSDQGIAEAWLAALATRYAPENVPEVLDAFRGTEPKVIRSDSFELRYSYYRGSAIDERLVAITQK